MQEYVVIMQDRLTLRWFRARRSESIANTAQEALEIWKKRRPDEADPNGAYTYHGVISRELADRMGFDNNRPGFDIWIEEVFLEWVKKPGNFIPLDGPKVVLEEHAGGRLHLSAG